MPTTCHHDEHRDIVVPSIRLITFQSTKQINGLAANKSGTSPGTNISPSSDEISLDLSFSQRKVQFRQNILKAILQQLPQDLIEKGSQLISDSVFDVISTSDL